MEFWQDTQRTQAAGHICGLFLLKNPGARLQSVLDLKTDQHRMLRDLHHHPLREHVAYEVVDAAALGSFMGNEQGLMSDDPLLLPVCSRRAFQLHRSNFTKPLIELTPQCARNLLDAPTSLEGCIAGPLREVLDMWSLKHGCDLPQPRLAMQLPAVFCALVIRGAWQV